MACFGWNTLPPLCSGTVQPRDWLGDGVCFSSCFFSTFKNFLKNDNINGVALVPAPALDVSLHVKSQMVRPGETSGERMEKRKTKTLVKYHYYFY